MLYLFTEKPQDVKNNKYGGAWMAQSVKRLTSAQVMISQSVSLSPTSGSVLTAQSLEPAADSVSPSLSFPSLACALSLSQKYINIKKIKYKDVSRNTVIVQLSLEEKLIINSIEQFHSLISFFFYRKDCG